MHEAEKAFDIEAQYSLDLDALADEKDEEERSNPDYYDIEEDFTVNYEKTKNDIPDTKLDKIFSKLL